MRPDGTGMTRRAAPFAAIGGGRRAACRQVSLLLALSWFPGAGPAVSRAAAQDSAEEQTSTVCSLTQLGDTVDLCLTTPLPRHPIRDTAAMSVTFDVSGRTVRPLSVDFELNGHKILSDLDPGYQFELPSPYFSDGDYTLSATARMSNTREPNPVSAKITLVSRTTTPPTPDNDVTPRTDRAEEGGWPFGLAAVGDAAGGAGQSAAVADLIDSRDPNLLLYLGDVYNFGTSVGFSNWYGLDTFRGGFRDITNPTQPSAITSGAARAARADWPDSCGIGAAHLTTTAWTQRVGTS